jgi:hypothetical protein
MATLSEKVEAETKRFVQAQAPSQRTSKQPRRAKPRTL